MSRWIGIDLGTYNSSAAWKSVLGKISIVRGDSAIPRITQRERTKEFPSFICFHPDGSVAAVGAEAKERAQTDPEYVVWGVKRLLGRTFSELRESGELERFRYRIKPDRTSGRCLVSMGERTYTPVELCAEILKAIKSRADQQSLEKTVGAVISVPAYFDPLRVTPIVEAAKAAGFEHVRTIPEPVAAALSYNAAIEHPTKVVVFDLGAGTLDVTAGTLYRSEEREGGFGFDVQQNTGDSRLGGIDMDDRLARLIQRKCGLEESWASSAILRRVAEEAKILLSSQPSAQARFDVEGRELQCTIDRLELRAAFEGCPPEKNLIEECRRQTVDAIYEAGWTADQVEILLPIGGPTRLGCILDVLRVVFHSNPRVLAEIEEYESGLEHSDAMTAVSTGAVLSLDRSVRDRVPYGYGIEIIEINDEQTVYKPEVLIKRNTVYPFSGTPYDLGWIRFDGRYELKLLQRLPRAEARSSGGEFRFIGLLRLAVRDPNSASIMVQMGYTGNRELEITIRNRYANECVTYRGISQAASAAVTYPIVKRESGGAKPSQQKPRKRVPSPQALEKFANWAKGAVAFVKRKSENERAGGMIVRQLADEVGRLLSSGAAARDWEGLYNRVNGLLYNAHTGAVLTCTEYQEMNRALVEHENLLFGLETD